MPLLTSKSFDIDPVVRMDPKIVFLPEAQSNVPVVLVHLQLHPEFLPRPLDQLVELCPVGGPKEE